MSLSSFNSNPKINCCFLPRIGTRCIRVLREWLLPIQQSSFQCFRQEILPKPSKHQPRKLLLRARTRWSCNLVLRSGSCLFLLTFLFTPCYLLFRHSSKKVTLPTDMYFLGHSPQMNSSLVLSQRYTGFPSKSLPIGVDSLGHSFFGCFSPNRNLNIFCSSFR